MLVFRRSKAQDSGFYKENFPRFRIPRATRSWISKPRLPSRGITAFFWITNLFHACCFMRDRLFIEWQSWVELELSLSWVWVKIELSLSYQKNAFFPQNFFFFTVYFILKFSLLLFYRWCGQARLCIGKRNSSRAYVTRELCSHVLEKQYLKHKTFFQMQDTQYRPFLTDLSSWPMTKENNFIRGIVQYGKRVGKTWTNSN